MRNLDFKSDDYESNKCFILQKMEQKSDDYHQKKGLQLNGQNPTMLYGYGGFNVSLTQVLVLLMPFG
jgi:prolyl oligopeptidase